MKESFLGGSVVKNHWVQSLGREDPLEEEMATHSSILAWKILRTEESGELQSIWSQELDTTQRLNNNKEEGYKC